MSVQAMSWVFEHSSAKGDVRLVLLAIANHADKDGRNSWASLRQLSDEAHCSERQSRYALRELESTGEIVEVGVSPHRTHVYELAGMATLWVGADIAPMGAEIAPADIAPGNLRPLRGQNPSPEGAEVAPEPKSNRPKGNRKKRPTSPEAETLCALLAELIEGNGSKRPKITDTWLIEADRIFTLDKRPPDEAERVLRWSQDDEFWRGNILSMPTFRKQYDRLRLATFRTMNRETREERLQRMAAEMKQEDARWTN